MEFIRWVICHDYTNQRDNLKKKKETENGSCKIVNYTTEFVREKNVRELQENVLVLQST